MSMTKLSQAEFYDKSPGEWRLTTSRSSSVEHLKYYKANLTYYHMEDPSFFHLNYTSKRNINNTWKDKNCEQRNTTIKPQKLTLVCFAGIGLTQ